MSDSNILLAQFVNHGSESAFRELVARYIDFVYSTALRLVDQQSQLAEDVSQLVFIALARKARTLPSEVMLGGWLHQHTRFAAANVMRGERRRVKREREALEMKDLEDPSRTHLDQIAPILDEALGELGLEDRNAILLRFFENKTFQSVGDALGASEDTARKRVQSAVKKLHALLKCRGATLSLAGLTATLATAAVKSAPLGLANNVAALALHSAATAGGFAATFATLMTLNSFKYGMIGLLLAIGLATVGVRSRWKAAGTNPRARPELKLQTPGTGQRTGYFREAPLQVINADALARAKIELHSVMSRAQPNTVYPPHDLRRVLGSFGNRWLEALPILLEYLDQPDFETRHWALSGISDLVINREGKDADSLNEALALFRPKVSSIFRSSQEPVDLRRLAFAALTQINSNVPSTPRSLDPEMRADITSVLQSADKKSSGFRFEIIMHLETPRMRSFPENVEMLREALDPLLQHGDASQQFLAASGLAALPGEKPPQLKEIFLQELDLRKKRNVSDSYHAADGLGLLGSQAIDAVPALLAFAQETKGWANGDYSDRALKAACLIRPDLRSKYPAIDAKLKEEELSDKRNSEGPRVTSISPFEMAATLSDPDSAPGMLKSFADQIRESDEPAETKIMILQMLASLSSQASEKQREPIQKSIDLIRLISEQKPDQSPQPFPLSSLTLDARILLSEGSNANQNRLANLLADRDQFYRTNPVQGTLTSDNFEALSKSIKEIDPVFHQKWVATILNTYPALDRIVKSTMQTHLSR